MFDLELVHINIVGRTKILLDELCPLDVYTECAIRIAKTGSFEGGILMWTIAPEEGLTEAIQVFLPEGEMPQGEQTGSRYVVMASWDDAPHLSPEAKAVMEENAALKDQVKQIKRTLMGGLVLKYHQENLKKP